jgi:hypothetical protein
MAGLQIANVIAGIADLTPSGVTILGTDKIPTEWNGRQPIMFPDPSGPISNLVIDPQTFGDDATTAKANVTYTLNYVYLHSPAGSGRGIYTEVPTLITNMVAIVAAICAKFSIAGYAVDMKPRIPGEIGILEDPVGNQFWGCRLALDILEFYEV